MIVKSTCRAVVLALALGLLPLSMDALPIKSAEPALAQESGKRKKPRRIPSINEATYRRLSDAQELIDNEQYADAIPLLDTMVERSRRYNGAEMGQVHNMLAYANYELDNIDRTIHHYEQVLAQMPDISEGTELTTLNQLSKLYFQEGNKYEGDEALRWYGRALTTMQEWLTKSDNPGPDAYFYVAQIYYQMKDFPNAINRLEYVVQLSRERGLQVREHWWTMLQFLYFEQENWPKVIEILEILVREFPKRVYWVNLASVYGETDQSDKQLWTMEAAHVGGYLDQETDIRTYGGLLLQGEIPNRAAKYLQQGFDDELVERNVTNLQTLGQAYQIAQDVDKAIPIFEEAGDLAEDGVTYERLSALYLEKDEHEKCQTAARNAVAKGGLKSLLQTEITLGVCMFNLDQLTDARKVFVKVRGDARRDRARVEERTAGQWITYIDSERRRRAEIARAGG